MKKHDLGITWDHFRFDLPPVMARNKKPRAEGSAPLGLEAKLWAAADALRNNMDAAEYKHVVLGLIFLKYISDAFEAKREELDANRAQGADLEDPDEYRAVSIFLVPPEARWPYLRSGKNIVQAKADRGMVRERAPAEYGENPDYYDGFFVPERARWSYLQGKLAAPRPKCFAWVQYSTYHLAA